MNPFGDHVNFASGPKIEAVNYLHAVFLLTAVQRRRPIRLQTAMVYFDVIDLACLDTVIARPVTVAW